MNPVAQRGVADIFRGQPMAVSRLQFPAGFVEIVDLEAEMMNAGEVQTMRPILGPPRPSS